jgi:NitT/TauT family transport system substrate-binding protein
MQRSLFLSGAVTALAATPLIARAQTGTTLRLGAVGVEDYALAYYAQQRGFFKQAGLDIDLSIFPGGGAASTALYAGALDLSGTNTGSMSAAHVRGLPVALLAGGSTYNSTSPHVYLVAAKDGPIRAAKDLAGKKIAVTSVGDLMQAAVMSWIDKNGGDAGQASFLEIPSPQMAAAVLAHRIDATVLVEPFYTQSKNDVRLLGTPFDAVAKQFMITGWVANDKWLAGNKATADRFAGVMRATAQWANANSKDAQAFLTTYTKLDPAVIAATNHVHWAERLDPAMIQPVLDVIVAYKMLPHGFPAAELFAPGIHS